MNSLDALIPPWMDQAWPLSLVVTLALGIVLLLRVPCRRWFGAERAFQLWLLVPLMLLLAAWPRAPGVGASGLPPVLLRIVTAPVGLSAPAVEASRLDWRGLLVLGWAGGVLWTLAFAAVAQAQFRRRLKGAQLISAPGARRPVWRAGDADLGPALVGLWRPWIIVPVDFETRYEPVEQDLILAHEAMHARRGDVWLSLVAQLMASVFWFLPFRGWALGRFRRDQELACDAAVLREHPARRRSYARAMLKTQSCRWTLPIGCLWSSHHPVTERIAMLKQPPPRTIRRVSGLAALIALGLCMGQLVFAAGSVGQAGATQLADNSATPGPAVGFTLRLAASVDGQPVRLRSTACYRDGDFYTIDEQAAGGLPRWHGRFTVVPAEHGQLEVRADLSGGSLAKPVAPHIRMQPGQAGVIQTGNIVMDKDGHSIDRTIKLELTAWPGCVKPAAAVASSNVQFHFATNSARVVAQSIAQQAGLTIENPDSLDNAQPVAGNFEGVPAPEALRLVGNLVGMTPVFSGKQVRFEPK